MKAAYFLSAIVILPAMMLSSCHDKKKDASAEATAEVMPVTVAQPVVETVTLTKTYPGFIYSNNEVQVVCQVNGKLLTKNYASGSFVQKGQVLFTIDPTLYRNQVQEAQAALSTARSNYDYYSRQYAAMQKALQADAVSQMDVIQAKSNMQKAQAAINEAQAQLSTAQTNLGYCTVRAPMSGYISGASLDPGNYIAGAGAPVKLATIYDNSEMIAVFSIEDSQYEQMLGNRDKNQAIEIPLQFSNPLPHEYVAKLYYVDVSVDRSTGTVSLKSHVQNPYDELKNEMYCVATLPYGTQKDAILVKDAAISTDQAGKYLYTVNDSNKVVYTPIEVGAIYQDSMRMVTKGINRDSRYVTKALLKVRDGMTIKPVMAK